MRTLIDVAVAVIIAPFVLTIAMILAIVLGLIGGKAGAIVAAWPLLLWYHDRYLLTFIHPRWTASLIERVQEYVRFHDDPNRPK
jgi:hypothetical protein